jgi:hypothetical protein
MVYGNGSETSLGRPFVINPAIPNGGGVEEVAGPFLNGSVSIGRQSNLWGADFNIRKNVCCSDWFRLDVLAGARVLGLDENLSITENLTVYAVPPGSGLAVNNQFTVNDRFTTVNRFYGAQVGVDGEMRYGPFSLGMRAKLAVGSSQQQVQIAGSTVLTQGTNRSVLVNSTGNTGGLLAQAGTNIGSYTRTMFGIVPEVGFTLGYDVFDWWRLTAGYNVLYWNSVARPGEQIDLRVNPAYLPAGRPQPFTGGATSDARLPAFDMKSSDMLIHGITLGMEFRY